MRHKRPIIEIAVVLLFVFALCWRLGRTPSTVSATNDRIAKLKEAIADRQAAAPDCVEDISRHPFVRSVIKKVSDSGQPTRRRIVHLRDWHLVPRADFDIDQKQASERELSKDELDALYEEHLLQVELVQLKHLAIIRCLQKYGFQDVWLEGVTAELLPVVEAKLDTLRMQHKLKETPERMDLLNFGVTARLAATGETITVHPLEQAEAMSKANPVKDKVVFFDKLRQEVREQAMVEQLKSSDRDAVAVLGGGHELKVPGVEMVRVTTRGYPGD